MLSGAKAIGTGSIVYPFLAIARYRPSVVVFRRRRSSLTAPGAVGKLLGTTSEHELQAPA
jgi:hypothetical protein